jgi:putative heme-binding domain-containing protein
MRKPYPFVFLAAIGSLVAFVDSLAAQGPTSAPKDTATRPRTGVHRTPWTISRLTGTPEPPPPYRLERVFPRLTFKNPLLLTRAPGTERFFIGEQAGKLYSFRNDPSVERADVFLDLTTELHSWDPAGKVKGVGAVYALTFHPRFVENRYCYVCYVLDAKAGGQLPDGSRISRFRVTNADPPRIDPASEKILFTWLAGGHNGCDLHFGPDGYLYISTGDGADPNPPDRFDTGQDLGDLLSSVLRIDVDHADPGKAYAVPPDNPFLKTPGARPEIWAYGFRNPWRMSFDRATGELWVGDVGWELWEMIYRVRRGGNYGWSVMEGPQQVRTESRRGPTPILPPAFAFPHSEAASITGGYVYHGKRLPEIAGLYLCGDWMTRKIWGMRFDSERILSVRELAQTNQRIVAFGEDHTGELYIVGYDEVGTIQRLVPNEAARAVHPPFPRKLSETGLFASTAEHRPAPGVMPFSVNAAQWLDHATAERFVALPGDSSVRMSDNFITILPWYQGHVFFPKDGVLARTISLEMERGNPKSRRRLETQVLHFDGEDWHPYTYRWNEAQTDATLVPAGGAEQAFVVTDPQAPGGKRRQNWHFPSRAECLQCHNPWTNHVLAFTRPQLDRAGESGSENDYRTFVQLGVINPVQGEDKENPEQSWARYRLSDPYDASAELDARARSYLQVNCAHCHQMGAGGTADIELRYPFPITKTKTLEVRPIQGTFEIHGAQILAPGDPYRSVLYYRMAKLGRGRMPHIGSEIVDERGLRLIHDWIRQLPLRKDETALLDKLCTPATPGSGEPRRDAEGRDLPPNPEKGLTADRADAINRLLSSTSSALRLASAVADGRIAEPVRREVVAAAVSRPDPQIRDLFERFIPDDQRIPRLGTAVKPDQILALKGDAARGRELFFKAGALQCINCHKIGTTGSTLGPDLSQIARKSSRVQILESILEPSKSIDPKYVTYLMETNDGRVLTGLLAERNDKEVVLRNVGDKEFRVPVARVETLVPQRTSLMPELLLRDLTPQQAADLVEFLASLK